MLYRLIEQHQKLVLGDEKPTTELFHDLALYSLEDKPRDPTLPIKYWQVSRPAITTQKLLTIHLLLELELFALNDLMPRLKWNSRSFKNDENHE